MSETRNVYKMSAEKSGHLETGGKILVYLSTCLRLLVRFNVSHPGRRAGGRAIYHRAFRGV